MITTMAIKSITESDGTLAWYAYRLTFQSGRVLDCACVGIFDTEKEAAAASWHG